MIRPLFLFCWVLSGFCNVCLSPPGPRPAVVQYRYVQYVLKVSDVFTVRCYGLEISVFVVKVETQKYFPFTVRE